VKVIAPEDFAHVVAAGGAVARGDVIDVDDETGAQLVARGWKHSQAKPAKKDEE
jgi:hypothetical protein